MLDSLPNLARIDLLQRRLTDIKPSGQGLGLPIFLGVGVALLKQGVLRSGHMHWSGKNFGHVSDTAIAENKKVSRRQPADSCFTWLPDQDSNLGPAD